MQSPPKLKFPNLDNIAAEGVRDGLVTVREDYDQIDVTRSLLSGEQDQEEKDDVEIVSHIFESWVNECEERSKKLTPPIASCAAGSLLALGLNAFWTTKSEKGTTANVWLVALLGGVLAGGTDVLCRRVYAKLPLVPEDMPHAALELALKDIGSDERRISRVRGIRRAWERRALKYNARIRKAQPNVPPPGQAVQSAVRLAMLLR